MGVLPVLITLLAVIVYLVYVLSKKKYDYWKKKNVPYLKPLPILGNYGKYILQQEYQGHAVQKLCQQFPDKPLFGAFYGTEPVLIVQSPELLKHVLIKDFYYFNGREITKYEDKECFTQSVFFSSGDRWKILHQNYVSILTAAKVKRMFHLIEKYSHEFEDMLDIETGTCDVVEAKNISVRFSLDCVCSCAFGVESNTMLQPDKNIFKSISDEVFRATYFRGFKNIFRIIWPAIFYGLGLKCYPEVLNQFFSKLLKGVFESRNHTPSPRNDFVDLLLTLKNEGVVTCDSINNIKTGLDEKVTLKLDDEFILAQCIAFFGGGLETSATALCFTLFEIAKNPAVQKRAAEEVDDYLRRHGNKLDFECTTELPYINACIYETLRRYPPLGVITREVMDDYTFPDGLRLDKGVRVHIPVYALHHNPDYFPEPEVFNPERFLPPNKDNIKQYTYFSYGEGPRYCTGKRFSIMLMVSGIITVLKKYNLTLAEGMPEEVPLEPRTLLTHPMNQGLLLKVTKRDGWEQRTFVRS